MGKTGGREGGRESKEVREGGSEGGRGEGHQSHKVRRNGRLLIAPSSITLMKFSLSCLNTQSTTQLQESKQNNNENETTHRLNSREKLLNVPAIIDSKLL